MWGRLERLSHHDSALMTLHMYIQLTTSIHLATMKSTPGVDKLIAFSKTRRDEDLDTCKR